MTREHTCKMLFWSDSLWNSFAFGHRGHSLPRMRTRTKKIRVEEKKCNYCKRFPSGNPSTFRNVANYLVITHARSEVEFLKSYGPQSATKSSFLSPPGNSILFTTLFSVTLPLSSRASRAALLNRIQIKCVSVRYLRGWRWHRVDW